jgi:hypothetical protein
MTSTTISTITNSFTSSQKPFRTSASDVFSDDHEKNVSRTVGQPLDVRIAAASRPSSATVETVAMVRSRRARRRRAASRAAWRVI